MDDHFLRLSEDALDDSKAGERLILCRKAAEAFCKAIAKDGFPEKVEGNLGRMIQHLYARKLIESNHKVSLEILRNRTPSEKVPIKELRKKILLVWSVFGGGNIFSEDNFSNI